jgi:hypothetical protein
VTSDQGWLESGKNYAFLIVQLHMFPLEDLMEGSGQTIRKSKFNLMLDTFFQRGAGMFMYKLTYSPSQCLFYAEEESSSWEWKGCGYHGNSASPFIYHGKAYRKPTSINPIKKSTGLCTMDVGTSQNLLLDCILGAKKITYLP